MDPKLTALLQAAQALDGSPVSQQRLQEALAAVQGEEERTWQQERADVLTWLQSLQTAMRIDGDLDETMVEAAVYALKTAARSIAKGNHVQ